MSSNTAFVIMILSIAIFVATLIYNIVTDNILRMRDLMYRIHKKMYIKYGDCTGIRKIIMYLLDKMSI